MNGFITIQGKVVEANSIQYQGRTISCWTISIQAALTPQPLDLSPYLEKIIEVSGYLHGDLWEARFIRVVDDEIYQEVTGKVIGFNTIESPDGPVNCYRHGMVEAVYLPLNLSEYMGQIITVTGELYGSSLYRASIVMVPEVTVTRRHKRDVFKKLINLTPVPHAGIREDMPRTARLDAPGVLHHIIIRGIERRKIFRNDTDRDDLIARIARLLPEANTACYAWVLLSNHAHFLLRTGDVGLATVMRRLLTGYAVGFNRRYKRHGQLFQNRYKSIVCQEDAYFKELVRYIHLNPIRGGTMGTS